MGKVMEIGVLGFVLLSFVFLYLVVVEVFLIVILVFVWLDLWCGFVFWVEFLFGGIFVFFYFRV